MLRNLLKSVRVLPGVSTVALLFALLASTHASAGFIDLSGLPDGDQGTGTITTPEGDFTAMGGGNWFKSALPSGDFICALKATSSGCGSWMLELTTAIDNLIFDVIGYNFGDSIAVSATDSGGAVLANFIHASADPVSFLGLSDIKKVTVTDNSAASSNGLGVGNFSFGGNGSVPVPGVLSLVLLGLFGMRLLGRRKIS